MKIRLSLLAIAASSVLAAPAFAQQVDGDQADIYGNVSIDEVIVKRGFVDIRGFIDVDSQSSATVEQDQVQAGGQMDSGSRAFLGDAALSGAQGNIHANISSGVGINQSNDAALSSSNGDNTFASAQVFGSQISFANRAEGSAWDRDSGFPTEHTTILDGDALAGVSGNVGVNVASGVGHGQGNAMAASTNTSSMVAIATSDTEQVNLGNVLDSLGLNVDVAVAVGGNVLSGAQGNIGLNATTGVGNLQHNGMAIASAQGGGG